VDFSQLVNAKFVSSLFLPVETCYVRKPQVVQRGVFTFNSCIEIQSPLLVLAAHSFCVRTYANLIAGFFRRNVLVSLLIELKLSLLILPGIYAVKLWWYRLSGRYATLRAWGCFRYKTEPFYWQY
jgi:hypothetical protein